MANIYRNQKLSLTSTADTVLYTVPSNSRAIVKSILIAEDNNASATAKVTLLNSSSTVFVIDNLITLAANENKQVISEPLIMEESEVLKVQAASGAVDVVASVLEINREDK
jgi:hypothetical protein